MINEQMSVTDNTSVERILEAVARLSERERHQLIRALLCDELAAGSEPLEIRNSNGMLVGVVCDPSWILTRTTAEQESIRTEIALQVADLRRNPESWGSIESLTVEEAFAFPIDQPQDK